MVVSVYSMLGAKQKEGCNSVRLQVGNNTRVLSTLQ